VQQGSLTLQDVVLDSCEYPLYVEYGSIKMRSVTIQGQTESACVLLSFTFFVLLESTYNEFQLFMPILRICSGWMMPTF